MSMLKLATPFLILSLALSAGARTLSDATPDDRLSLAVQRGDRAAVEALLRNHVPVNSAEGDGTTPPPLGGLPKQPRPRRTPPERARRP